MSNRFSPKYGAVCGLAFLLALPGTSAIAQSISYLNSFTLKTGSHPASQPILASDGNYYGVLPAGARNSAGSIYRMTANGEITVIHNFKTSDGATPLGRLLQAGDGALYGSTFSGGSKSCGTLFRMALSGKFDTLHIFNCKSDGGHPKGGLIEARNGQLYGTAQTGGTREDGTVFSIQPLSGEFRTVANFARQTSGSAAVGELLQTDNDGFLGVTSNGGQNGGGTLYSLSPEGVLKKEYAFFLGETPTGGLAYSSAHDQIWGTLVNSSVYYFDGAVHFVATVNFGLPTGGLTLGPDGDFYGFCSSSDNVHGCAYKINLAKISWLTGELKASSYGQPTFNAQGNIFGVTTDAGKRDLGAVFELDLSQ